MMRHKKKLLTLTMLIIASGFVFWPGFKPNFVHPPTLHLTQSESFGENVGAGNVVGIEPVMEPLDYATAERFKAKISGYMDAARAKGWFTADTIVLLPEHLATWLIATDVGSRVYSAEGTTLPLLRLLASEPIEAIKSLFIFDDGDPWAAALFRSRAGVLSRNIEDVFGGLAKEYGVTLIAGSAALMTAGIYDEGLSYGHGPIFNASFVFGPDGKPLEDAVRKSHPILAERGFITPFPAKAQPVFEGAGRKFSVLICADSWFNDTFEAGNKAESSLVLVPAFLTGAEWQAPWGGYIGDQPEHDAWIVDIGQITEGEAWIKYAMPAKAKTYGVKDGMTVFLKGDLWGERGNGRALILEHGTLHIGAAGLRDAAIYNLWLQAP
ncbi:hypothetical protein [Kordiimonas sp.]|uniref:hypothetical protein n=1 Tax=Kordiimonas sp. TaxID=1970157 RepID=UPI003B530379